MTDLKKKQTRPIKMNSQLIRPATLQVNELEHDSICAVVLLPDFPFVLVIH